MTDAATPMKARLRSDLRDAMRQGRRREVALLRELIAAIDNAEAVPRAAASLPGFGSGAAEVPRLRLDGNAVRALLRREIESRARAAAEFGALGAADRATALRDDVLLAERYLDG